MKIYEALYNDMIEESSFTTISIHRTREGAEKAAKAKFYEEKAKYDSMYKDEDDKPYEFGEFEAWDVYETELLD